VGFAIQMNWNEKRFSEITFPRNEWIKNIAILHNVYKPDEGDSDKNANNVRTTLLRVWNMSLHHFHPLCSTAA
jgi:hypothetical protein